MRLLQGFGGSQDFPKVTRNAKKWKKSSTQPNAVERSGNGEVLHEVAEGSSSQNNRVSMSSAMGYLRQPERDKGRRTDPELLDVEAEENPDVLWENEGGNYGKNTYLFKVGIK